MQATNAVWIPWNIAYIAGYEACKRQATQALGKEGPEQLPAWALGTSSAGVLLQLCRFYSWIFHTVPYLENSMIQLSLVGCEDEVFAPFQVERCGQQ